MAPRHWRRRRSYRTCLAESWGLKNRPTNRNSTFFKRPVYSLNVNSSGPSGMQPEAAVAPEPGTPRAPSTPGCHVPLHGKGRPRSFFMMESGFVHCCFEKWKTVGQFLIELNIPSLMTQQLHPVALTPEKGD